MLHIVVKSPAGYDMNKRKKRTHYPRGYRGTRESPRHGLDRGRNTELPVANWWIHLLEREGKRNSFSTTKGGERDWGESNKGSILRTKNLPGSFF